GNLAEAEAILREALDIYRNTLPDGHWIMATGLNNLAGLLYSQGKLAEAEPLFREALKIDRESLPRGHPNIASDLNNLASLLRAQGRLVETEVLLRELYDLAPRVQLDPRRAALYMSGYGVCMAKLGKLREAEEPLLEAYRRLGSAGLANHERTREVIYALARVCEHTNRPEEAAKWRAELASLVAATQHTTEPISTTTPSSSR
ncbi:MAG: tetratricopeptide repeat protein, partial [Tepidisphaeraceae bacterium]